MSYVQLVNPNLSTVGDAGWCLWMAEEAFGVPHLDASAEDAWNATHFPHPNEQPPNAIVPVYWTYFDVAEDIEFGHIAIWVPGWGVFSSPFDEAHGNQRFGSIQAVTDRINQISGANSRYLGWSEDLAGVQIIKNQGEMIMVDNNMLNNLYQGVLNRQPDHPGADGYIGQPADVVLQHLMDSPEYAALQASRQDEAKKVDDLTAANQKLVDQLQAAKIQPAAGGFNATDRKTLNSIQALIAKIFRIS